MMETMDWNYAIAELLEKQGIDLRREMEDKLFQLEEQFKREKERSDHLFELQKKEYEDKIQTLQEQVERHSMLSSMTQDDFISEEDAFGECTWNERQYQLATWAFAKWRHHQFTSLRDALWGNALYLKEANSISLELNKKVQFQFALLTDTMYTPLPNDLLPSNKNTSPSEWPMNIGRAFPKTVVAVEVQDLKHGATHYWSMEKFKQRLEWMRQFALYDEASPQFFTVGQRADQSDTMRDNAEYDEKNYYFNYDNPRKRLELVRNMYDSNSQLDISSPEVQIEASLTCQDPFYDRFPWFRLVGRAFVFLTNIYYNVPLIHRVAIVSEKGDVKGFLRVAVQIIDETESDKSKTYGELSCYNSGYAKVEFNDNAYFSKKWPESDSNQSIDPGLAALHIAEEEEEGEEDRFIEGKNSDTSSDQDGRTITRPRRPKLQSETTLKSVDVTIPVHKQLDFNSADLPAHLQVGSTLYIRVTVLQATGVSSEFADIFCQFNFLHRQEEAFSTEPMKNSGKGSPLGFYHVQNFAIPVTLAFVDYIRTQPLLFEMYGHQYVNAANIHNSLSFSRALKLRTPTGTKFRSTISYCKPVGGLSGSSSRRSFPPTLPISAPVPAFKVDSMVPPSDAILFKRLDLLVWFEIMELGSNGEYLPTLVEHYEDAPCQGVFLIHQGLQRRISITIVHENCSDDPSSKSFLFHSVREIVVGRVRDTPEYFDSDTNSRVLSLSIVPTPHYTLSPTQQGSDERLFFRAEAAWDSSLHESTLLNLITESNQRIWMTMSCYLDVEGCSQPVCMTKDLCMMICARDSKLTYPGGLYRSIRSFFGGFSKFMDTNRVSGLYDFQLKRLPHRNQRRSRRVIDTSSTYVRGEENLRGWRPRSDSLILDHQWELEKLSRLEMVEKARHILLLREKLSQMERMWDLRKLDSEARALWKKGRFESMTQSNHSGGQQQQQHPADDLAGKGKGHCGHNDSKRSQSRSRGLSSSGSAPSLLALLSECDESCNHMDSQTRESNITSHCLKLMTTSNAFLGMRSMLLPKSASSAVLSSDVLEASDESSTSDQGAPNALRFVASNNFAFNRSSENAPAITSSSNIITTSSSTASDFFRPRAMQTNVRSPMHKSTTADSFISNTTTASEEDSAVLPLTLTCFIGSCDEIRVSPVVSRRGYLSLLEEHAVGWQKRWVVVRRPFLYIYNHDRDPVERGIINLATAKIEYNPVVGTSQRSVKEPPAAAATTGVEGGSATAPRMANPLDQAGVFTLATPRQTILVQTMEERSVHDWLYAFNPLMAGLIRSKMGRKRRAEPTAGKSLDCGAN